MIIELNSLFGILKGTIGALPLEFSDARYLINQIEDIEKVIENNYTKKPLV